MKAIILAAGQGTRLRPVTLTMPKSLVPVANKHLIEYAIDTIKGAGITDIGIVVNNLESPIVAAFDNGHGLGVKLEYIVQDEQLGLAHATGLCRDFVGDEPFAMFLGDNIFQDKMSDFIRTFPASNADASIVLAEVSDPSRFGIAVVESGEIKRVIEKPKNPPSNLAIVGVYLFRNSIFDAIGKIKPSARGEYEITDAIQQMITEKKAITPYKIKGWYIDAGKPEPIILANQLVLEGLPYSPAPTLKSGKIEGDSEVSHRVIIGDNSRIVNSVVRGPVIIGDNTIIQDSYVGPYTAIGDNCHIEGSEIEASIVMNNCVIRLIPGRIDRSLLADNAQVVSTERMPTAYRFVLAENTIVEV
ncbi:MAG: glucose-1-phosphate thymidylyltransferase [Anaerolineae bacterium]|nr:glucose-1-phosphate thymidylyltransferase [Anaerolineae bacterium]